MHQFSSLSRALLLACFVLTLSAAEPDPSWKRALPGWEYQFPRDHYAHDGFKTEWWYFTGNLATKEGHAFGYQLTFFRQGLRSPAAREVESTFVRNHFQFAHFAISDLTDRQFHFQQRLSRGAFGESGVSKPEQGPLVWIDDWKVEWSENRFSLLAKGGSMKLSLQANITQPPIFHGKDGVSPKSPKPGNASHYYSHTRLLTDGTITLGDVTYRVAGNSWLDREWGTSQLGEHQTGWDWFSLQFEDESDLMLFQIRDREGKADQNGSGTLIRPNRESVSLKQTDFSLTPLKYWTSQATKAVYPIVWQLVIPAHQINVTVTAALNDQELVLLPISYWEGAVTCEGTHSAKGYLELTGYSGPIKGLR